MTSTQWQKFTARQQGLAPAATLHEGVPDHLDRPMRAWIYRALQGGGAQMVALRLKIAIDYERADGDAAIFLAQNPLPGELLDIVDAILALGGPWPAPQPYDSPGRNSTQAGLFLLISDLVTMLAEGRSAYRVNDSGDGLTTRVADASAQAYQSAVGAAGARADSGSAADHLKIAWDSLYDLRPDPPKAYRNAISAVEAAAHALIEPNNASATLGTMMGQLRSQPQLFELAISGPSGTGAVTPLIEMMSLLWCGQTSRHGAQTATRMETRPEAEMALHLAVVLVHWFTTGAVRRK